jgi:hypothetical protein
MHSPIDGASIGQHPLVSRLLRGAFQSRPPLPRYTETWDVARVLAYTEGQEINEGIPLKLLTLRTTMLLALSRPVRSVDLCKLNLTVYRVTPEGAVFRPTALAKQSRPGRTVKDFFFPRFTDNSMLCPVTSLEHYVKRTEIIRGEATQLFISFIKPHRPVMSSTIARWLKEIISAAGIDTNIFKAHSVRGATTSAASTQGVTTEDILIAADWSTQSSFQKVYCL